MLSGQCDGDVGARSSAPRVLVRERRFGVGLSLPNGITRKSVKTYYTAGSGVMYFEINRQDSQYAYSVGVWPSGTTTFSGLTITYTQPAS
jgi:hypothetical protein